MAVLSEAILYYVQSNDNIWAVTSGKHWLPLPADSIISGLMLYQVSSDDIQIDGDQLPSILISEKSETLPLDIAVRIAPHLSGRFDAQQDSRVSQTSHAKTSDSAEVTPNQQGINLGFQLIANTDHHLTPTSGFDTRGDSLGKYLSDEQNSGVEQDGFLTLQLSVAIQDAGDGYINSVETPVVDLIGQAIDARDGQALLLTLTDIYGQQISLDILVTGESWQVTDLDISILADGVITAEITAPSYPGIAHKGQDTSIKDTQAGITVEIVDTNQFLNATEMSALNLTGQVNNVENGQTVTVSLTDDNGHSLALETLVVSGAWFINDIDLSGFDDGSLKVTAATLDIAGNPTSASTRLPVDILASITIEIDTGSDTVINASESLSTDMSGTVFDIENGQAVTVQVADYLGHRVTFSTTVVNGLWQIQDADLSSLTDGELVFTATAADLQGNLAESSDKAQKDTQASVTIAIVDNDDVINAAEISTIEAKGSVTNIEDGQVVTINFKDNSGHELTMTTTVIGGQWSVTGVDLTAFDDGSLVAEAQVIDKAGNNATATSDIPIDTQASITINVDSGKDTVINQSETLSTDIYGTVKDIEDGQTVSLEVIDKDGNSLSFTTTVTLGQWSLDNTDLSALLDGPLTFNVSAIDLAGNPAHADLGRYKETQAVITIGAIDTDGVLNGIESAASLLAGLVNNVEDGRPVLITVTDNLGTSLTFTSTVRNGVWTVKDADLSSLADGSLILQADTSDLAGNLASNTNTIEKDTGPVKVTIEITTGSDDTLNQFESPSATLHGQTLNIEDGRIVTITVTDINNRSLTFQALVNDNLWQLDNVDLSSLADGAIAATADVSDIAGNNANAIDNKNKNVVADIEFNPATEDQTLNATTVQSALFQGDCVDIEDGQTVTVTFTDSSNNSLTFTSQVTGGQWLVNNLDLSSLLDGDISVTTQAIDIYGNPASDTTSLHKDTQAQVSIEILDNNDLLNPQEMTAVIIRGSVTNIEDGCTVTVTLTDGTNTVTDTAIVTAGIWQLSAQDLSGFEDGMLTATANVMDAAGNTATANTSTPIDLLASVTISVDTSQNVSDAIINAAEMNKVDISGTTADIENNQTITVVVRDASLNELTFTTTVINDVWNINDADLSSLTDGALTFEASVSDLAGNLATSSTSVQKDSLASITIEIDTGSDTVINASESLGTDMSGTVFDIENGQAVTIQVADYLGHRVTFSTTVVNGLWQIQDADLSSLADGELVFTATAADLQGNLAESSDKAQKDTQASVTIAIVDNDGVLNPQEMTAVIIRGSVTNIEDGRTVTVTLTDGTNTVTDTAIVTAGIWQLSAQDLSGFEDGMLTATANVMDAAGNTATANTSTPIDLLASVTISVDTSQNVSDAIINAAEMNKVDISGTTADIENNQTITVVVRDASLNELTFTTTVINDVWNINDADLSSLTDGALTFDASVSDLAGNLATSSTSVQKDSLASITIEIDTGSDTVINASESLGTDMSGTVFDIENGQAVTIQVADYLGHRVTFSTTVVNGLWQIQDADLSSLADGELVFTATSADLQGNLAESSDKAQKDTQASVTIAIVDNDGVIDAAEISTIEAQGSVTNIEDGASGHHQL
ncbi:beta strand repeat-containing protein [Shewanella violacea]|uniref:RTX toxin n=1 Tax=Shewanella violacea (strain JCM 10179 / CIP 106290 / LMG 19151 / DSS12) TaxID=637905 RepID=D4ZCP2_SHEVD|nr:hypothetical protein [Shewanella violacea]BAJ03787.1 hypothetical protein SVI_3816 [Shewanella violacea DSS12]